MWQQKPYDKDKEESLRKQGKSRLLSRLLSQRNMDVNDVDSFLTSDYNKLSHPYLINDLEKTFSIQSPSILPS